MEPKDYTSDLSSDFLQETRKSIGERIRYLWVNSGEPQDIFVKQLGISTVTLSNYMSGKRKPDSEFLFSIKKKLNICIDWLLTGEGAMRPGEGQSASIQPAEQAQSSETANSMLCTRCERLEAKLEKVEGQRDELVDENRRLLKENGLLREENATLRERQRKEQTSPFDEHQKMPETRSTSCSNPELHP